MTEPPADPRKVRSTRWAENAALLLVLALAAWLRLRGIGFGLPSLNDPDEPLFMMTAIEMLQRGSFDPGWFGHPGTTTLYSLAATVAAVGGAGLASGHYADLDAFAAAVYADPGLVFLPARVMIAACGLACVWLTWRLGRHLGGARLGLAAAGLLAINAVHVAYSQIVRTDVQASLFMLLATLSAVGIARQGRLGDYVRAGVFVGLAVATKWPAALIALGPLCAGLARLRAHPEERGRLAGFALAAPATLLAVSPFLLLHHETLLHNLVGEARPTHPGATGGGFLANLAWYASGPLAGSLGVAGLALAVIGLAWGGPDRRLWRIAVAPGFLAFLVVIAAQTLRWERWVVPLLPFACLAAARGLWALADVCRTRWPKGGRWIALPALAAIAWPMIAATQIKAVERARDTRQIAAAWVRAHVPPGQAILVEHAAFDLLRGPWSLRFPLGAAGCIDVRRQLAGQVRYSRVERARRDSPIVDLGHVDPATLPSCAADYGLFSNYGRYPPGSRERRAYDRVIGDGRLLAVIAPQAGVSSGPTVYLFRLGRPPLSGRKENLGIDE